MKQPEVIKHLHRKLQQLTVSLLSGLQMVVVGVVHVITSKKHLMLWTIFTVLQIWKII